MIIFSLKWNKDKKSMAVSKQFIKKVNILIRHLSSKYTKDKKRYASLAAQLYTESLEKGENRRILYGKLKEAKLFSLFMKLVAEVLPNIQNPTIIKLTNKKNNI